MQKGSWIWWEPLERARPGWMISSQKRIACTVVSVDESKGTVSIEGLTPARRAWGKVVPIDQVFKRGA